MVEIEEVMEAEVKTSSSSQAPSCPRILIVVEYLLINRQKKRAHSPLPDTPHLRLSLQKRMCPVRNLESASDLSPINAAFQLKFIGEYGSPESIKQRYSNVRPFFLKIAISIHHAPEEVS